MRRRYLSNHSHLLGVRFRDGVRPRRRQRRRARQRRHGRAAPRGDDSGEGSPPAAVHAAAPAVRPVATAGETGSGAGCAVSTRAPRPGRPVLAGVRWKGGKDAAILSAASKPKYTEVAPGGLSPMVPQVPKALALVVPITHAPAPPLTRARHPPNKARHPRHQPVIEPSSSLQSPDYFATSRRRQPSAIIRLAPGGCPRGWNLPPFCATGQGEWRRTSEMAAATLGTEAVLGACEARSRLPRGAGAPAHAARLRRARAQSLRPTRPPASPLLRQPGHELCPGGAFGKAAVRRCWGGMAHHAWLPLHPYTTRLYARRLARQ